MPKTINKTHGSRYSISRQTLHFSSSIFVNFELAQDLTDVEDLPATLAGAAMELVASTRLSKEGSRPQWVKRYDAHEPQFCPWPGGHEIDGWRYYNVSLDDPNKHISGEGLGYTVMELTEFDRS